ncbi:LysR family transcriptional regulator [Rhodococcus sp. NPDC003382]|uniref:LysR family transcriptional regulator n=1 Tax=unclassified Rhodococcus (in: high G+C Gram-positive bacteria) TaxID=192944 RepID=UPI0018CEBDC6|nr:MULTISPECIES: LysR family transcriptional regulator [unclassified Rhodococcus (in: high G+C Gram-positive bacteria)]MBH0119675.1 LysR family transcriptional regulator [Rhodococcus sp. CX]MCK8672970.1 LysR family transcriptional regulator [Rhodococcus sp. HM1]
MEISQLQAFLAVAEELHFGRAAEKLHRAQPPLSRTIKQLERELDTELFSRSTRAVKLTASGEALVGPARDVLDALRRAEAAVRAADDGDVGLVRIAFAGASTHQLVARLARVVRSQRPGIQLELSSQNFAQPAMKKLVSGETDIALGRWDIVPAEVAVRVVMQDSLVVALPDTHPLAGEQRLSIARFAAEGFVSLPPHEGAVLPDRLRRLARAGGFVPDVVQVAPDTQTALALVSAEVGCHLTLASVAANVNDPHVVFVPLDESTPDVDLRVAWRRDDPNPASKAVLRIVLDTADKDFR